MSKILLILCAIFVWPTIVVGQDQWVAYNPNYQYQNHTQSAAPYVMLQTQVVIQKFPVLNYEWIPYYFNKAVITEKYGFLCHHQTIRYEPSVVWLYQPVWRY